MDTVVTIGLIAAVILGIIGIVQSRGLSVVAWSATIGFGVLLLARLT